MVKEKRNKGNLFKYVVTLIFVISLTMRNAHSVKYPFLAISLQDILSEFPGNSIKDLRVHENKIYLRLSNNVVNNDVVLKIEQGKFLHCNEENCNQDLFDAENAQSCKVYNLTGGNPMIDAPNANYQISQMSGNQLLVNQKNPENHFSVILDEKIKSLFFSNATERLYAAPSTRNVLSIYEPAEMDGLKHLGDIPLTNLCHACFENGCIYLEEYGRHYNCFPDDFTENSNENCSLSKISVMRERDLKKLINIETEPLLGLDIPKLVEHKNKLYAICGEILYIFPVYPNLKSIRALICQGDYNLYFANIMPSPEQYSRLKELVDQNQAESQKTPEKGLNTAQNVDCGDNKLESQKESKGTESYLKINSLDEMPEEVLCHILEFLDENDLIVASQVNKKFYDLSNDSILQLRYLKLALYAVHGKENDDKCIEYLIKLLKSKDKLATEIAKYIVNKPIAQCS